ncbi:hypothetical protein [Halopiger goleimassiliensis]|uniref:hypothetical protein n=1 Tax=Halopiger goleimassiliensis TaxID=1293048 RepID=UPI0006776055|nr:hypothetical protein [Halopiger goleimassiliensis]
MTSDDSRPTRRAVLKSGVVATGAVIGASTASATSSNATADRSDPNGTPSLEGAMYPYQLVPGRRASVVETELGWRPAGADGSAYSHVIAYEHAPSLRALFVADEALSPDQSVALGSITSNGAAGGGLVSVEYRTV